MQNVSCKDPRPGRETMAIPRILLDPAGGLDFDAQLEEWHFQRRRASGLLDAEAIVINELLERDVRLHELALEVVDPLAGLGFLVGAERGG